MALTECDHGMVGPCSMCRRRSNRCRLKAHGLPPGWFVMEASFDSRCPGCGGQIDAGEEIFRTGEGDPFICQTCALEEM